MRLLVGVVVACGLGLAARSHATPRREVAPYLPIMAGMTAVGQEDVAEAPRAETWLIAAALRAHGLDLEAMPAAARRDLLAAVPSYPPAFGPITSPFGARRSPFTGARAFHSGLDIGARQGAGAYAVSGGVVTHAGWKPELGRVVTLDHGGGLVTQYAHLSKIGVKKGAVVRRGELLGRVGSTGRSTGSHLHYEVRINGAAVDPARFFMQRGTTGAAGGDLYARGGPLGATARLIAGLPAAVMPFIWR